MRSLLVLALVSLAAPPSLAQHASVGLKGGLRFTEYTGGVTSGMTLG